MAVGLPPIEWKHHPANPVIRPGGLHGALDALHAGAAHVLRLGRTYRLYYWARGSDGRNRICAAESPIDEPNDWKPLGGSLLEAQPQTDYNCGGPSFPFVVPRTGAPWLMYFGAWGRPRPGGKLPNTTGLALSHDEGLTWHYAAEQPLLPLDRPWDSEGTGSVCVLLEGGLMRMYYTAIGGYGPRPEGVRTAHGDIIPRIGIGYAESEDGLRWRKPLGALLIPPRGFGAEPYEYIVSKPFVIRDGGAYRMWVSTCGTAYRVRSLVSPDGLSWRWLPSGPDGELGVGEPGAFDDRQRCYACVVKEGAQLRCWYTGNGYGATGIGYAVGTPRTRP